MLSSIDVPTEKLCYIPCSFCNIVLAVSVPCSSLTDIVTVRCGHCTNLWSVNMAATFHSSSHSMSSPSPQDHVQAPNCANCTANYRVELGSSSKCNNRYPIREPTMDLTNEHVANRLPEKRPRVPSAYNQFIKEEIQRLKANNPEISHRDAFSTAAKNWAHFPNIHFGLMLETNNSLSKLKEGPAEKHLQQRTGSIFN